jgi:hypothetical protein
MMMAASITTAMNVDAPMVKALKVSMCGMVCLFYWLTNGGNCLLCGFLGFFEFPILDKFIP